MYQQVPGGLATVVVLPDEIDMSNADQVYDLIDAAAGPGTRVVIADCTATTFCDAAGVRRLVTIRTRAAARGVQVRLVIAPGGMLRRVLELLAVDNLVPVYTSVGQASMMLVASAQDPLSCPVPGRAEGTSLGRLRCAGRRFRGNGGRCGVVRSLGWEVPGDPVAPGGAGSGLH